MYTISSEQIIGSYAVKYKTLVPLINIEYAGNSSDILNIFIDLTDILKTITSQIIPNINPYSIAASIVNLCAHYRNFFYEYYKTNTKFFLIKSDINHMVSINCKLVPSYRRNLYSNNPIPNNAIDEAMRILDILVPYIEDINLKFTNYEFGVHVYDVIQYEASCGMKPIPGLVLTKDPYSYQLVSNDEYMVKILRPKKEYKEDTSFIINSENVIYAACAARKTSMVENALDSSLLSLIYALSRVPERNIQSLHQLPAVIKALDKAVKNGYIMNSRTSDIGYVCNILSKHNLLKIKEPSVIIPRFNAIDIENQYMVYTCSQEKKYTGMVNLYDPESVKKISMEYFSDFPLDLNVL